MEKIEIIDAAPEDASMIADAIMAAVGDDIVNSLAEGTDRNTVHRVFATLATREDSQYSYKNTRLALSPDGKKVGVCISYPGGEIFELRKSFFRMARDIFRWETEEEQLNSLPGETTEEEYYLDTLATLPEYRGRGIGKALIADAKRKADAARLPLGLLVADHNDDARRLYESIGFKEVGRRFFAGEEMSNMRLVGKN